MSEPATKFYQTSDSVEWYTPSPIIEAARRVLGGIDLDPASCETAQRTVGAASYYTRDDDGLSREWCGRVWMNPPFGKTIRSWTQKLRAEFEAGRVSAAVVLVPASVDTRWYRELDEVAALTCHMNGRLRYSNATNSAPFRTALLYFGPDVARFRRVFSAIGRCYRRERVTAIGATCVTCRRPFSPCRSDAEHCSGACRQRAYRARRGAA